MPRYYRRRYTRVVKPKKKWASNILTWDNQLLNVQYAVLAANNTQNSLAPPTPTIIKVGNFKLSIDMAFKFATGAGDTYTPAITAYILYVPEGWGTNFLDLISKHPEWIMNTKTMGSNTILSNNVYPVDAINMSTRLKRNLNSGDQIILYVHPNTTSSIDSIRITGTCRFWTCSN